MNKYFVWVAGLRGPVAQIWDDKEKTQEGRPIKTLTQPRELHPSEHMIGLMELSLRYPHE